MTIQEIKDILDEFNVQRVNYPNFSYDIKNMKVMVEGYWATDCISTSLNMQTLNVGSADQLRDMLRNNIESVYLENSIQTMYANEEVKHTIRLVCITTDMRINKLEEAKNKKDKASVVYIYSPSSTPSSKL